jgi:phosphomannomutase
MIQETISAVLMKNGIDVFDLGMVPTPVVFREARKYGAGIVISSSHNPIEWNGMKFILDGRGINEKELPQIINHQEILKSKIGKIKKIESTYIEDARKIIGNIENSPKIAIDNGGGAAKDFAIDLLKNIGCDVEVINQELLGCSRGPDPTSDELIELSNISKNKDIGFAFDLDGDRLVVVRKGKKQTPDVTLGLGIAKSLELGYKKFVLSIDTSVSIEKFIKEKGGTVVRSKVGEANVIEEMLKNNSQAGGEGSSAGFILPEFNYCREGILTSGLISSMLENAKFSEILNYMESYFQIREKIEIDSNYHEKIIDNIKNDLIRKYSEIDTRDGIKAIIDENTWILIRKSNTEDIIRISGESNDEEKCKMIINNTIEMVKENYDKVR